MLVSLFLFVQTTLAFCQTDGTSNYLILHDARNLPPGAKKIRTLKVSGQPYNGFESVAEKAAAKAMRKGGNVIVLTSINYPSTGRYSFILKADVYSVGNIVSAIADRKHHADSLVSSLISADADYTLLYAIRPQMHFGTLISYNLHADDSVVCRIKNGESHKMRLAGEGNVRLWARTESRETINAAKKPGSVILLECTVTKGMVVGAPSIKIMRSYYGIEELLRNVL